MSAADFDPYHRWLGIPPDQQPATHYRLLGIAPFEADPSVITKAAGRQIVQLRQLLEGQYAELARQLIAEIGKAKATLLSPAEKTKYDQSLASSASAPAGPAEADSAETEPATETQSLTDQLGIEPTFRRKVKKPQRPSRLAGFLLRVVPFLMIGCALVFLLAGPLKWRSAAPNPAELATSPAPTEVAGDPLETQAAEPDAQPESAEEKTAQSSDPNGQPGNEGKDLAADRPAAMAGDDSGTANPDRQAAMATEGRESVEMSSAAVEPNAGEMPPAQSDTTKLPAPDKETLADAVKQLRARYKVDFANAKASEQKVELAKKLLTLARDDDDDDTTNRFGLFKGAIALAVAGGDFSFALGVWNELGETFDVDVPAGQWEMLGKLLKTKNREQLKSALDQFIGDAADADRFDLAREAIEALVPLVEPAEAKRLAARQKELEAAATRFDEVKSALARLASNPADPAANRTAGQYIALVKLDWSKGLPLLSRSDDETLKGLAKREFTQPDDPREQVKLGDAWWDYAKAQENESLNAGAKSRAQFWYQLALPELGGADRQRVEARTSLEGRMRTAHAAESELKLTPKLLASKLHADATYDAETNRLTLSYNFDDKSQLEDFNGQAECGGGKLSIAGGESLRHFVKFKTLKLTGVVAMKSPSGDIVKSSAGLSAHRDGESLKVGMGVSSASTSENVPADDAGDLPLEIQSGEKLVLLRLGDAVAGKVMAKSDVGQVLLCGGDEGATFSKLVISGEPDRIWLAKFFDLPPVAVEKSASAKRKSAGKYGKIRQLVIWNEHNGPHHNCGTRTCNVTLALNGKTVWKKTDVEVPWEAGAPAKVAIDVPQVAADAVRVEITAWHATGGGLAEVEVQDPSGNNLAKGAAVITSAEHRPGDPRSGATLVDGNTDSATESAGYWILPEDQPGWAEIRLIPQEAAPSPESEQPLAAKSEPAKKETTKGETAKPPVRPARNKLEATVYAVCDDQFEMRVNGTPVLHGAEREVFSANLSLATGDVITVKATNDKGDVGFWCVMTFANGQTITTGDGWQAYAPADPGLWFNPKQIRHAVPAVPGDSEWPAETGTSAVGAQGRNVPAIWSPDREKVCYLSYLVGPIASSSEKPAKKTASESKKLAGKKAADKKPRIPIEAKLWASADDMFEMAVNGKSVLKVETSRVETADTKLAAGDLITVKATNTYGELMGFACSIKLANGQTISTGDGWSSYVPENPLAWSEEKQIQNPAPVVEGNSRFYPDRTVSADSQIPAQQIWAPGRPDISYFVFVVGPLAATK